jgi:nicotinamidase-related amidase
MEQNTQNTALLVMDMQTGIVGMLPNASAILGNVVKAIAAARKNNIPVIYVVVGFRTGLPEISANNKGFSAAKERFAGANMDEFIKVHPDLAPQAGEVTVIKRRVSAFTGSDLEVVLRAKGIQHMVLTGIATSGVVLSTVREASDKDYRLTVLADCCADRDAEVHHVLTTKVFPGQAEVLNVDQWSKSIKHMRC